MLKFKNLANEVAWLAGILVLVSIIALSALHIKDIHHINYTIDLHDTYLVVNWKIIILIPFLLVATVFYLIKEAFYRFKRTFRNWMGLIINFFLVLRLIDLILFISSFAQSPGWKIYPPLVVSGQAMPDQSTAQLNYLDDIYQIKMELFAITVLFIVTLVWISIMTGRNNNTAQDGSHAS